MKKRILAIILTIVLAACTLMGCSFFSHDDERDMQQEIATVKSYKIVNTYLDDDGNSQDYEYVTQKKTLYKLDLLEYVQNNASTFSSYFGSDLEALYTYGATMLANTVIVTNEVDALIDCGQVEWGTAEQNEIRKSIYQTIDTTLFTLKNTILDERGLEQIVDIEESTSSVSTTYPIKPDPTDADDDDDPNKTDVTDIWEPERINWPGINGDSDTRSLEREAMRRFIALIKSRIADDFRLDKPDLKWLKTKINNEIKAIDNLIDTAGIEYVYPVIGSYSYPMRDSDSEFGYIMYYITGESLERSQKITVMQEYLTDSVTVRYSEVADSYTTMLNEQKSRYDADIAEYDADIQGGSTTVLYHPNNNYFYVKHILLPFSDEQSAALAAFSSRADIVMLQEDEKAERINEERARLAQSIVCYPHKDGEDDLTNPMSVDDVIEHIRHVMTPLSGNVKLANDAFNDLIYLYNTDPGAFGNDIGYLVNVEGDSSYMEEFTEAARYIRKNLSVGEVYYEKVLTDYGVHIMYLSYIPEGGKEVGLNSYTSPDRSQTYYDLLEEPIRSAREDAAFTDWQNNILTYNFKKYTTFYTDAYSDLWED